MNGIYMTEFVRQALSIMTEWETYIYLMDDYRYSRKQNLRCHGWDE